MLAVAVLHMSISSTCPRKELLYMSLHCCCQQEQLNQYQIDKQLLLGKSKHNEQELEALSRNYAKLLGHQNQKQKIHHILKLKEENMGLKQVCLLCHFWYKWYLDREWSKCTLFYAFY